MHVQMPSEVPQHLPSDQDISASVKPHSQGSAGFQTHERPALSCIYAQCWTDSDYPACLQRSKFD